MHMSFSSVAPAIAAAIVSQHADVTLYNVNMSPAHSGFLRYAILMGARIHILDQRWEGDDPVSNLRVQYAKLLQAITVREEHIETLQAELHLLAMMAVCAKGTSQLRGFSHTQIDFLKKHFADLKIEIAYENGVLSVVGSENYRSMVAKIIDSEVK